MDAVLVLNNTFEPLSVISVKRAVKLLYAGKAKALHDAPGQMRAEKMAFPMPSVLQMLYYIARKRETVALTKKNVLLRDDYRCGYCAHVGEKRNMTVDHVVPKSRGGISAWTNLVACCEDCNGRKRNRTPHEAGMPLLTKLRVPKFIPWIRIERHTVPGEWGKYLSLYSVDIEERVG